MSLSDLIPLILMPALACIIGGAMFLMYKDDFKRKDVHVGDSVFIMAVLILVLLLAPIAIYFFY